MYLLYVTRLGGPLASPHDAEGAPSYPVLVGRGVVLLPLGLDFANYQWLTINCCSSSIRVVRVCTVLLMGALDYVRYMQTMLGLRYTKTYEST